MGKRRGHAAHQVDACDLRCFRLPFGTDAPAHRAATRSEFLRSLTTTPTISPVTVSTSIKVWNSVNLPASYPEKMQKPDQAELGDGQAEARAIEPVADAGDHNRNEQQVEQPETVGSSLPMISQSARPITGDRARFPEQVRPGDAVRTAAGRGTAAAAA